MRLSVWTAEPLVRVAPMQRYPKEEPSGIYRFQRTPQGRRPLARNQAARALSLEQARLRNQLQWSLPLAALIAVIAVVSGLILQESVAIYTAQVMAFVCLLPAAAHLSRWSRLQQAQRSHRGV